MSELSLIPRLSLQFLTLLNVVSNLRRKNILVIRIEREVKGDTNIGPLRGVDVCMHNLATCTCRELATRDSRFKRIQKQTMAPKSET